jgi:hypothetical protein
MSEQNYTKLKLSSGYCEFTWPVQLTKMDMVRIRHAFKTLELCTDERDKPSLDDVVSLGVVT